MCIVRVLGWVLLIVGFGVLGRDVFAAHAAATFAPVSLFDLWSELGRDSLYRLQLGLAPYVWQMVRDGLGVWATPVLLLPGFFFVWLGKRRAIRHPS